MSDWMAILALLCGFGLGWIMGRIDACYRCVWHLGTKDIKRCSWRCIRKR